MKRKRMYNLRKYALNNISDVKKKTRNIQRVRLFVYKWNSAVNEEVQPRHISIARKLLQKGY